MNDHHNLTSAEEKLADIIWSSAPISSPDLVDIAYKQLDWKKSTTYTVLRRLCEKGIFKNTNATVTAQRTRQELLALQSRQFVNQAFSGSLPSFIAAFVGGGKLSPKIADELVKLIEAHQEEN